MIETTEHGGYPVLEHLRLIVEGPVVWAPAVDGAVLISLRGDDFELVVGQDLSIKYLDHDAERVRLYLEESVTFRAASPEAASPWRTPRRSRPPGGAAPDGASRYDALNRKGSIPERRHRHDGRTAR